MIETEIKFKLDDLRAVMERVEQAGGALLARFFEDNLVYDDEGHSLFREKRLLRLRKSDRTTLTYKSPVEEGTFKVMDEHEVELSSFEEMDAILRSLGYRKVFRYQKRRAIYRLGAIKLFFDETPIGDYLEIEGTKPVIEGTASALGLDLGDGTSKNYFQLYREHRSACRTAPPDMVF